MEKKIHKEINHLEQATAELGWSWLKIWKNLKGKKPRLEILNFIPETEQSMTDSFNSFLNSKP